jgi:hypothetical protein
LNTKQQKALAWEAYEAGNQNGGDSSPIDGDYADIQVSIRLAFEAWWGRRRASRRSPSGEPRTAAEPEGDAGGGSIE